MKRSKNRKKSFVSLVLALVLVLSLGFVAPSVRAESLAAWDATNYQDLEDVDAELIEKYLTASMDEGFAMDATFNVDLTLEMGDAEQPMIMPIVFSGDMNVAVNQNFNTRANFNLLMNIMGETDELSADLYIVDDPTNPDNLTLYAQLYDGTQDSEGQPVIDVVSETIARADLDELTAVALTPEDFSQVASLKVVEDKGDTVDAILLVHFDKLAELADSSMDELEGLGMSEEDLDDLDDGLAAFEELNTTLGISEFVMPINVTLEKETGHLVALSIDGSGLQELIQKAFESMEEMDDDMSEMQMNVVVNDMQLTVDNVRYGVTEEVTVPEEIIAGLAAFNAIVDPTTEVVDGEEPGDIEEPGDTEEPSDAEAPEGDQPVTSAGGFEFTEPILFNYDEYELVDQDATIAYFEDLNPVFSFVELDPSDERPTILVTFTNNTPYPIESLSATGKSLASNEAISYYFFNNVVLPGETAVYDVTNGYSDYNQIESEEDFQLTELSANFMDAPNHQTYVTYDAKLKQISYASGSDYEEWVTEPLFDPEAFTLELGVDEYGFIEYVIHNNSDLAVTDFRMVTKSHDNYPMIIYSYETLLPGDSSATMTAYSDSPEFDDARVVPLRLEVTVNMDGEESTIYYDYGLDMFMIR